MSIYIALVNNLVNIGPVLIHRLSGRACGPDRGGSGASTSDQDEMDVRGTFWSFSKVPFKHSLLAYESHEMEDVAIRMFNSTLVYAGIESAGKGLLFVFIKC